MLNFAFPTEVLERITLVDRPPTAGKTEHLVVLFDNDFGLSILRGEFTYGAEEDLFEACIVRGDQSLSEGDPIGNGEIIGWLSDDDVIELARRVSAHTAELQKEYEDTLEIESIILLFESVRVAILRTDGDEDPRDEDNPAYFREGAIVSQDARDAVRSTTKLFIRKIQEMGLVIPTYLIQVLEGTDS